ncbi:hypothetical protein [Salisediminibacterium beveridgei]|uniref:Uncharacterized protein n=1 Tax=Salisediminibacterium beveridgei TaxID=632773 RepID=A0A1D7QV32_9BACI|nr:hypothetical protein [Salisediminibacterium beveridgei]AOM82874.1 hypothetical protein BBEV_1511 [Salisediminibacterium beveridgei]
MNRPKSYRLLLVVLFIVFVSMISRSILYLVISMTVAVIIIFLLSKDMKSKTSDRSDDRRSPNTSAETYQDTIDKGIFPMALTLLGAVAIFYGFSGIFTTESLFHATDLMTNDVFVQYFFFILGLTLFIYGSSLMLKRYLSK